jgi:hypothetical protein
MNAASCRRRSAVTWPIHRRFSLRIGRKKRMAPRAARGHRGAPETPTDQTMAFRIRGLAAADFAHWFALDDAALAARHALRRRVDAPFAYPCRISLTDAAVGDDVLLINFEHLAVASPYRSRHAIYIRAGEQTCDVVDTVPDMLRRRLLSLRAFDAAGLMSGCDVVDGRDLEAAIANLFAAPDAVYLHAHFARPGCYAARIERH